jgi:hypothetical protein
MIAGIGFGVLAPPVSAASSTIDCTSPTSAVGAGMSLAGPAIAGSELPAGSSLELVATWTAPAWAEKATLLMCVTTNGTLNAAASEAFAVVSQDGTYTAPVTVPADLPPATDVCVRGLLVGHDSGGTVTSQASDELCFRTAATSSSSTTSTTVTTPAPAPAVTTTTAPVGLTTAGTMPAPVRTTPVAPAVSSAPVGRPELPRTGRSLDILVGVATGAILMGAMARLLGRRRTATG